ncbi:MAG: protein translocase subunit SecF [Acidobacteria bacterium]|nr:protein translocase subunit SecF [Acidobacteriota bacterium]MCI0661672.1 protein translocase subunit SecF [Acidobacteriota bacterium]
MIEIFRQTNYDFLSKKWICIWISLAVLLLGLTSIIWRAYDGNPNTNPFNLGVDFTGGTIVNAKFKERPDPQVIRATLEQKGIEGSKITIQPVGDEIGQAPKNEVLIRLPNLSPSEKEKIIPLLNLEPAEMEKLKSEGDADIGGRIIRAALATLNDSAVVKDKEDLNTISRENLRKELVKLDPLKLSAPGETRYQEITNRIIDYREKDRSGLIGSLDELKNLSGLEPQLAGALEQRFYTGAAAIKSTDEVSPQVGGELRQGAIFSSLAACIGMLLYVAYRFKSFGFGIGGVTAVFHDVLMTVGIFSIMQWEINLTVIAALLTLVGFSMNDTIVIFDRIREIMRTKRREGLEKITNIAVNETMSRTVITNGLAFLTVLALVLFGGEVLKSFSWALFIGVIVGTYSTVYIASPVMLWWEGWRTKSKAVAAGVPATGVAGEQAANLGKSSVTPQMLAAAGISTAQRKHRKKGK